MPLIALTGNLASGKSTILRFFKNKGAIVFDTDKEIHYYYRNKRSLVYRKIAAAFPECLKAGVISRKILAAVVFSDKFKLKKLEQIVHPVVIKDLLSWAKLNRVEGKIYVAEIPLLFEKKITGYFEKIILVAVKRPVLIQRIIKKYGFSKKETIDRLSLYRPIREKIKGSDFVIDNSSNLKRLKKEVDLLWKRIK
ncbi:MAG: dephospho-CoA kinase [Candidatus Omnitrophota bacterium]